MQPSSVDQHMSSTRRALTPAEHAKATRLYREMKLYSRLLGGAPAKPKLTLGTEAFRQAAQKDYADQLAHYGEARFPASFVVRNLSSLPETVCTALDVFCHEHQGRLEVAHNSVGGQALYQVHVHARDAVWVLLVDAQGSELARGHYCEQHLTWDCE